MPTKRGYRWVWIFGLLVAGLLGGWEIHRQIEEGQRVKLAPRWMRDGRTRSWDFRARAFVWEGLTNAEVANLPAQFRGSDWTFLIHEGLRPDTRWERATGLQARVIRSWPISLLLPPYCGETRRWQLLGQAWGAVTNHSDLSRIYALQEAAKAGTAHPGRALEIAFPWRMEGREAICSAMGPPLKLLAKHPETDVRRTLLGILGSPHPDSDMSVVREVLCILSVDLDLDIAASAADKLLPPNMRRYDAHPEFLEAPNLPTSLLSSP